ncbi:MAG: FtsQ-type POTRA domain-containing protein [Porticoccaceae bacterium]|nr:FtsQ-type POTRA domain-containing protein [Porticoccaceae bacterium]
MSKANSRKGASRPTGESRFDGLWSLLRTAMFTVLWSCFALGMLWGGVLLYQNLDRPIERISVQGDFNYASREQIAHLVRGQLNGGFLSLDLNSIRSQLERDPWIANAVVSRRWPGQLVISVSEEMPIARWNRRGFLNSRGQALDIEDNSGLENLPLLLGPRGQAREIMEQYQHAAQMLLPSGLKTMEFRLDGRGAWYLKVVTASANNALEIEVGQGNVTEKLKRFLVVYDAVLRQRQEQIAQIDIRYPNGVAVSWRSQATVGKQESGEAKHG